MSCEGRLKEYLDAVQALDDLSALLRETAETLGPQLAERPTMLMGGEVNTWRRYALEAEVAAQNQREALERYLEHCMDHGNAVEPEDKATEAVT